MDNWCSNFLRASFTERNRLACPLTPRHFPETSYSCSSHSSILFYFHTPVLSYLHSTVLHVHFRPFRREGVGYLEERGRCPWYRQRSPLVLVLSFSLPTCVSIRNLRIQPPIIERRAFFYSVVEESRVKRLESDSERSSRVLLLLPSSHSFPGSKNNDNVHRLSQVRI